MGKASTPADLTITVRDERWGSLEDLPDRLEDAGYSVAAAPEDGKTVFVKDDCNPTS